MLKELNRSEMKEIFEKRMQRDFPPAELKPWKRIADMLDRGIYFAYGLYEEDELMAYAFFVSHPKRDYVLLDYYAVTEQARGTGIGSRFLSLWKEELNNSSAVLAEVENPDFAVNDKAREMQERRIAFYEKNDMIVTDICSRLFSVEYKIMYLPIDEEIENEVLYEELNKIYHFMFPEKYHVSEITMRMKK